MTVQTLINIRKEDSFKLFWAKALKRKEEHDVYDPVLKRERKLPLQGFTMERQVRSFQINRMKIICDYCIWRLWITSLTE